MFEYAETYHARTSGELESEAYRFLDRDGSTLALRADMTIPVARLVATRLHDWPMPQRFCYAGSVFRYTEPQAGMQREFAQTGAELIGSDTPQADAEIMALTARALHVAGIDRFQLLLGQMRFFGGLLEALQLPPERVRALHQAIDRNSDADLMEFLRATPLTSAQRRSVEELPLLSGPNLDAVLLHAGRVCLSSAMQEACANLAAVSERLDAYGEADHLFVDLTEIHDLGYYTGITFEALTPELGFAVAGGGRYDHLVATFGAHQPAVGVALTSERLLLARRRSQGAPDAPHPVAPDVIFSAQGAHEAMQIIDRWRALGLTVAADVDDRTAEGLLDYALSSGARYCVTWTGSGADVLAMQEPGSSPAFIPAHELRRLGEEVLHAISSAQ